MAVSNYEHECLRAELLGLDIPDRNEFDVQSPMLRPEELACETEQTGRVSGGLDELNQILDSTKKKLTRYQSFNKKLGKLFHNKAKSRLKPVSSVTFTSEENLSSTRGQSQSSSNGGGLCQSSLNFEEYERQNDKLDSLLCKAERAELSLSRNNKLIKKCL